MRWGAYCPLASSDEIEGDIEFSLFTNPKNPDRRLVYRPSTVDSDHNTGKINFRVKQGNEVKFQLSIFKILKLYNKGLFIKDKLKVTL